MVGGGSLTRDEKLENLFMNHSMILMGMFDEAFSTLAENMTAMEGGTAATADALGAEVSPDKEDPETKVDLTKKQASREIRTQIGHAFSGIREEMASQWPMNASVFKRYISSPIFDKGIEIVEKVDFGRPKLTERLSDEILASYVFRVQSGDPKIGKMFRGLSEWQSGLPKAPWAD